MDDRIEPIDLGTRGPGYTGGCQVEGRASTGRRVELGDEGDVDPERYRGGVGGDGRAEEST